MYQKIMDKLDAQMVAKQVKSKITALRIEEIIDTLDDAYGTNRKSGDYGGFVLYFPTEEDYINDAPTICRFYNVDQEMYEYKEIIGGKVKQGTPAYMEILYLQGSDNSIVMVFPTEEVASHVK